MKKLKTFLCPLKQTLDDFRIGDITLDEMLEYLYEIDSGFKKKVVRLQKEYSKEKHKEYKTYLDKWKKLN